MYAGRDDLSENSYWKTQLCDGTCGYDDHEAENCSYAHGERDLR